MRRLPAALAALAALSLAAACAGRAPEARTPEQAARLRADSLLRAPGPPVGLQRVLELEFPPIRFEPPVPDRFELSNGVTVFFLRDPALPMVDVFLDVKGGYLYEPRENYATAAALLPMMRNGGTTALTPDSLDALVDFHAMGVTTSTNGSHMTFGVSGLVRQLDLALGLWSDILLRPRFDPEAVERWRRRELESVRRRADFPGSLAVLEFNRLMYGDHPNGWIMNEADLAPGKVGPERLRDLHGRVVCPERAVIGAAGDLSAVEMRAALEEVLGGWQPCGTSLEPAPGPALEADPTVYVIHRSSPQSTVVVGQPGGVLLEESPDYFASRVANWIIGGSGFTSRLVSRLRTEEGLAYSASSIWGTARSYERILGAITHTGTENTVAAARVVLETLEGAPADPPTGEEVRLAREAIVNGFVFGFGSPSQVVARQVSYLADGLPPDWLDRYLQGVRDVDSTSVAGVLRRAVRPGRFTILIVGDTTGFDPTELGPTVYLPGAADRSRADDVAQRPKR